jgi:histidine phosphotransferase ChpT
MAEPPSPSAGLDDLLLTQLLCTRLCHDLAGPVGAVAAGVELAAGDPGQVDEETLSLIGSSSAAASRKLKFLRAALGIPAAGAPTNENLSTLVEGYVTAAAGRAGAPDVRMPSSADVAALAKGLGPTTAALILNLCLLVLEALPVCRSLTVTVAEGPPARMLVEGHGEPQRAAAWRPEIADALDAGSSQPLSVKTVQPHLAGRIARAAGGSISLEAQPSLLRAIFTRS